MHVFTPSPYKTGNIMFVERKAENWLFLPRTFDLCNVTKKVSGKRVKEGLPVCLRLLASSLPSQHTFHITNATQRAVSELPNVFAFPLRSSLNISRRCSQRQNPSSPSVHQGSGLQAAALSWPSSACLHPRLSLFLLGFPTSLDLKAGLKSVRISAGHVEVNHISSHSASHIKFYTD